MDCEPEYEPDLFGHLRIRHLGVCDRHRGVVAIANIAHKSGVASE
jgi:hypothetical protein